VIVPATGVVNNLGSRIEDTYGSVFAVGSGLRSDTRQGTLGVNGFLRNGVLLSANYTLARSRDQSSFSCCNAQQAFASPTTAADPNDTPWGTSDLERRHVIVTTATMPLHPSLELTVIGRATSGQPYTPRVASDINGDGARNDRAFILRSRHHQRPSAGIRNEQSPRECIGTRARMSGIAVGSPWPDATAAGRRGSPRSMCVLNYRPDRFGLKRNLMLSLQLVNPLSGLDRLLHGDDELRLGAATSNRSEPALRDRVRSRGRALPVRGQRTIWRCHRDGHRRTRHRATAQSVPGRAANARYNIGPDRMRQAMLAAQQSARGPRGPAGGSVMWVDSCGD
jgi:hypothetical protein